MTHKAPTERDIDEVDNILNHIQGMPLKYCGDPYCETIYTVDEAKQAIATHYRQKFEKLGLDIIGEDEDDYGGLSDLYSNRNEFRAEMRANLRAKLKEEL